ncbi:hypothetical protein LguiB_009566 [Lonicera macranthoides]
MNQRKHSSKWNDGIRSDVPWPPPPTGTRPGGPHLRILTQIVEQCNGLPLAITAAAAAHLWRKFGDDSSREWSLMEESLIGKAEDVAEDYLEDLICGSLIVVVKRRSDGAIIGLSSSTTSTSTIRPRRLSIHSTASRYISFVPYDTSGVHALVCFEDQDELNVESFRPIYKGFQLLKVLDLGSIIVYKVPNQVEKLVHIRYMRMNAPNLKEIPSYISNLSLIQTLDLRESEISLTQNFCVMQQLRHLFLSRLIFNIPISLTTEDRPMLNLQTLFIVSPSVMCLEDINGNPMFPNLTKLGLLGSSSLPVHMQTIKTLKFVGDRSYHINLSAFSTSLTKVTFMKTKLTYSDFAVVVELPNLCILKLVKLSVPILECSKDTFPKLQVLHFGELDVRK